MATGRDATWKRLTRTTATLVLFCIGGLAGHWLARRHVAAAIIYRRPADAYLGEVELNQPTIREVLELAERRTHQPIRADWGRLGVDNVFPDERSELRLRLRTASSRGLLHLLNRRLYLTRAIDKHLELVSGTDPDRYMDSYSVGDLIRDGGKLSLLPDTPVFNDFSTTGPSISASSLFANAESAPAKLMSLVTETVTPDSWRTVGGDSGDLLVSGNTLVVWANDENQHAVAELIDQIRRGSADRSGATRLARLSDLDLSLDAPVVATRMHGTLSDAIDKLQQEAHLPIAVDWHGMKIDCEWPAELAWRAGTLQSAIHDLLSSHAPDIDLDLEDGIVLVSNRLRWKQTELRFFSSQKRFHIQEAEAAKHADNVWFWPGWMVVRASRENATVIEKIMQTTGGAAQ